MKFLTLISAICLASVSLSAQNSFHYSINGKLKDKTFDGRKIYLYNYNDNKYLDSTIVKGDVFAIKGTAKESSLCRIIATRSVYANVILENGNISVDFSKTPSPKGTPMNNELSSIEKEISDFRNNIMSKQNELSKQYSDKTAFNKAFSDYYEGEMSKISKRGEELIAKNNNNAIGEFLFNTDFFPSDLDAQAKIINTFGPWLKSRKPVVKMMNIIESKKKTSEGKKFLEVVGQDINGKKVALSDFVGKGDYVLVDMWASWCGPCKREIPNIAKLYEKYKGKGFNVVGIFVWDKAANLKKAVESEKAVWPQIFDSNDTATKSYGVRGIPSIMLIAPDGTIVKRDLRGQQMIDLVDKLMNKK